MPDSSVRLSLKYNGVEVDDGSMPLNEVVSALQGFAGAYGKVANTSIPESTHELRVTAVRQSSFELHILAWIGSEHGTSALHAVENVTKAAGYVFGVIKSYIELKKHLKADRYEITIGDGNTRLVVNRDGESKEVPREVIDLLRSGTLDSDLRKMVAPLREGAVDTAELKASDEGQTQEISIASSEKGYFGERSDEYRIEEEFIGRLISNNKETLRGTFELSDGTRFPYHYIGQSPELFQSTYAFRGEVRVLAIATMSQQNQVKRIEIETATVRQLNLEL